MKVENPNYIVKICLFNMKVKDFNKTTKLMLENNKFRYDQQKVYIFDLKISNLKSFLSLNFVYHIVIY